MTSNAQSISYENTNPLLIVRGSDQYLYDEKGTQYLDTRNNVCHVGHCNTVVADAVAAQVCSARSQIHISVATWHLFVVINYARVSQGHELVLANIYIRDFF